MDFAAQLASLDRAASRSSNERKRSPPSSSNRNYGGGRNRQRQRQDNSHPLDAMVRQGYRVDPPQPPPPKNKQDSVPHICLLAITIDDLAYEHIWKEWAAAATTGATRCYVSVVCHAKFPGKVKSPWLSKRLLVDPPRLGRGTKFADPVHHTRHPQWGSVEISRAMHDCLQDAVEIGREETIDDPRFSAQRFVIARPPDTGDETAAVPTVDKFIFISETCLPVKTLEECREALFTLPTKEKSGDAAKEGLKDVGPELAEVAEPKEDALDPWDISWLNARCRNMPGTPRNKYEVDQFGHIHHMVHGKYRWKADQWIVLSRRHALAVLNLDGHLKEKDQLWNAFAKINASDEMYFPTALAVLRILREGGDDGMKSIGGGEDATEALKQGAAIATVDSAQRPAIKSTPSPIWKRPVTYTDWSEGMRNPTTFTGGRRDLLKVAPLARKKGCLFARKFAPKSVAGDLTGEITAEEWAQVMQEFAK